MHRYYSFGLILACVLPIQSAAAVSTIAPSTLATVNSHLNALSWLTGQSFQCEDRVVYNNGKSRTDNTTVSYSTPQGGWITIRANDTPIGFIGYDPNNGKYVQMTIDKPGSYGAGYFHMSGNSIVYENPVPFANVTTPMDMQTLTPSSNGYTGVSSGASDRYPGATFKDSTTCTRK